MFWLLELDLIFQKGSVIPSVMLWGVCELGTEKAMAPHSSTLAWKIPWAEEPGRLHAVHGVATSRTRLSDFTFTFHFHALEKEIAS